MTKKEFFEKWVGKNEKRFMKDLNSVIMDEVITSLKRIDYNMILKSRGKYAKEKTTTKTKKT